MEIMRDTRELFFKIEKGFIFNKFAVFCLLVVVLIISLCVLPVGIIS